MRKPLFWAELLNKHLLNFVYIVMLFLGIRGAGALIPKRPL